MLSNFPCNYDDQSLQIFSLHSLQGLLNHWKVSDNEITCIVQSLSSFTLTSFFFTSIFIHLFTCINSLSNYSLYKSLNSSSLWISFPLVIYHFRTRHINFSFTSDNIVQPSFLCSFSLEHDLFKRAQLKLSYSIFIYGWKIYFRSVKTNLIETPIFSISHLISYVAITETNIYFLSLFY